MKLVDIIREESICIDLASSGKMEVLAELGAHMAKGYVDLNEGVVTKVLVERERLATTGIGEGVAIPHGKLEGLSEICVAVGISKTGIPFDAVDGRPVHIFFALLAPLSASGDHLRALAGVSRLLKDPDIRSRFLEARTEAGVLAIINEQDGKY